jgi:DNA-binding NtrC family response regulator
MLIGGERGTGREMIARAIHAHGANAYAPFVKVDCSSPIPEDLEQQLFGMINKRPSGGAPERRSLERLDRHSRLIDAAGGILFLENVVELPARPGATGSNPEGSRSLS